MIKADVVVLGGGPGGYRAAERAAQGGLKTVLIEKRALGGTCLNEGCVPSKALLNSAKLYEHATQSTAFGVTSENARLDHGQVLKHKNKVVKTLVAGVRSAMKTSGVQVVNAEGVIKERCPEGFAVEAGGELYLGEKLILACGSEAVVPPIPGLREGLERGFVMTSREILDMETLPKRLVIIGGGVIGLEMASYFNAAGTAVTVIEMLDKIGGPTENEVSALLLKEYRKRGIDFKLSCRVTEVTQDGVMYEAAAQSTQEASSLNTSDTPAPQKIEADAVLCAIGRRAATQGTGLENLGVSLERGAVVTDEYMQTNVPGVYAVGDINGKIMLAHTAYREAETAVNHILGKQEPMRYRAIPSVIYTNPEVACVGETKESAEAKGLEVKVVKVPMRFSGRYLAEVEKGNGFCKLVVDAHSGCLLGAHLIGSYASEMIYGPALMIEKELPAGQLEDVVFPHPTVSEVIREAIFEAGR